MTGFQGKVCNSMRFRRFAVNNAAPERIAKYVPMILSLGDSTDSVMWHLKRKTKPSGWVMTLPINADSSIGVKWQHTPRVDPDRFSYDQGEFRRNEQILLHIDYMQDPAYFNIRGFETALQQLPTRTDAPGSYYYDDVDRRVTFSLSK